MDTQRLILAVVFSVSLMMVWQGWQKHQQGAGPQSVAVANGVPGKAEIPTLASPGGSGAVPGVAAVPGNTTAVAAPRMTVTTDVLKADISAEGGNLVRVEFMKHKAAGNSSDNFVLLDAAGPHDYVAQSGLIGTGLPNHKTLFQLPGGDVSLAEGKGELQIRLKAPATDGVVVEKVFTFHRGSYLVDVSYAIQNGGPAAIAPFGYFQFLRDGASSEEEAGFGGSRSFTGPAVYTEAEKYENIEFSAIDKGSAKFPHKALDGWVAMVQHYFVAAWLPKPGVDREYFARKVSEKLYAVGTVVPAGSVASGASGNVTMQLYVGPQDQNKLKTLAPGLDLVANYGWLTVIALPLFWVLQVVESLVGNWGWAIIGLTVLIKLVFFPLSAASYKSMARMKVVTPKMQKLKEQFGHDKARLNQEMMELYKKEKINPLGGCLPILVQIPVFIALYSVLLGAVEMRHAPWVFWIHDLSAKDPFYVLPLIMGVSMLVQTKLNPTPPDPVQAKVMLIMPIVFTGMFLFFPSGLVLYWVVNNLLSIAQQWHITRLAESGSGTGH
ncbi:MAG: membrane protein insertase YidC [Rhodocyclaceae bacterium]|nr:membrane protein insertase YidC [Rhodocyclaceae bacterium]